MGILHIDIDGNDYWVWKAIDGVKADVVIVEYNSVFGRERAITVPYRQDFERRKAHHCNLYWGASVAAFVTLGESKGYSFVGSNSAGNNAFFVRNELVNAAVQRVSIEKGYRESKFRDSRNIDGQLSYLRGKDRLRAIEGMPVVNVLTGELEKI